MKDILEKVTQMRSNLSHDFGTDFAESQLWEIVKFLGFRFSRDSFVIEYVTIMRRRPNLPEGNYEIVRSIEIDPNEIWIKYGQEVIDTINVLEDNKNIFIDLIKTIIQSSSNQESTNDKSSTSKTKEIIKERIIEREVIKPSTKIDTPTEETTKNIYTTKHITNIINIPLLIFTLLLTIVIILGILLAVTKNR